MLQERVIAYCNNRFINSDVTYRGDYQIQSDGLVVADNVTFSALGFYPGCDVIFLGTKFNNNRILYAYDVDYAIHLTDGHNDSQNLDIIMRGPGDFFYTPESVNGGIIKLVEFPRGIELNAAIYLKYLLEKAGKTVKSESLPGGLSYTYKSEEDILSNFKDYRKPVI
jgi:hypothetical protein